MPPPPVDAERAVDAAARAGKILMVGHLLEYHPAVARLKALIDGEELGDLYYIYGNRLNLGKLERTRMRCGASAHTTCPSRCT